jgi:hypothetical protein
MANDDIVYLRAFVVVGVWAIATIGVSMLATGRVGKETHWTHPEHRLLAAGVILILVAICALSALSAEFDRLIRPLHISFNHELFQFKKTGRWDEASIEMLRSSMERSIELIVRTRDLIDNMIMLISGGVGGGLISQGLIEKHQRRLQTKS